VPGPSGKVIVSPDLLADSKGREKEEWRRNLAKLGWRLGRYGGRKRRGLVPATRDCSAEVVRGWLMLVMVGVGDPAVR